MAEKIGASKEAARNNEERADFDMVAFIAAHKTVLQQSDYAS